MQNKEHDNTFNQPMKSFPFKLYPKSHLTISKIAKVLHFTFSQQRMQQFFSLCEWFVQKNV